MGVYAPPPQKMHEKLMGHKERRNESMRFLCHDCRNINVLFIGSDPNMLWSTVDSNIQYYPIIQNYWNIEEILT